MARFLWGSAATLLLVALVLSVVVLNDNGEPPMLLNPSESLVDEGVAVVMLCGEQPTRETVNQTVDEIVRQGWAYGRWTYRDRQGDCTAYYHHPIYGD